LRQIPYVFLLHGMGWSTEKLPGRDPFRRTLKTRSDPPKRTFVKLEPEIGGPALWKRERA